ncbi:MAG: ribosome-associated translation inhibitor RaiA [Planctomycetaceae bacterium]|nr:ribosome-associated translation inhibitor RaiA [Planctomycetaceae bacterium]
MNIQLTAKKIEIPPEIRDYAKEKLEKLEKFNAKVQSIEAVIKAEERFIVCELVIHIDNRDSIVIEVQGDTIQSAVDMAENKAERQLRKSKERSSVRRRARAEDRDMP